MKKEHSKKNLLNYHVKMQLGIGFIAFNIILLFSFFIFNFLLNQLKVKEYDNAKEMLNTEATKIELYFKSVDGALKRIATDKELQENLLFLRHESGIEQQRSYESVTGNSVIFTEAQKMNIYIYDIDKNIRYCSNSKTDNSLFSEYFDTYWKDPEGYMFFFSDNINNDTYKEIEAVSIVRRIYNSTKGITEGFVEISIDRDILEGLFGNDLYQSLYLYDENGNILYPFTEITQNEKSCISNKSDFATSGSVFLQKNICNDKLSIAVYYDNNQIFQSFNLWKHNSLYLIIMALLSTIVLMSVYAKVLLKPLVNLRQDIKKIHLVGTGLELHSENYDEEFRLFIETFNEMMKRISISRNRELDAIKQTEKAKYEALQAQISPHFIQNVLFDLQIMIMDGEQGTAYKMCRKLSFMLRYIMETEEMNVPLESELEYVRNYLDMHQLQYETNLSYDINYPQGLAKAVVPKLSIQPFVENSIKHGFYSHKVQHPWIIRIDCEESEEGMIISMKDNGCGMSREQIESILGTVNTRTRFGIGTDQQEKIRGIGMVNTLCRWKYLYGEYIQLSIWNRNPGTEIGIQIEKVQDSTHKMSI